MASNFGLNDFGWAFFAGDSYRRYEMGLRGLVVLMSYTIPHIKTVSIRHNN